MFRFTSEQKDFISEHVASRSNLDLTRMFNDHFGLAVKMAQIKSFKKNNKLSSGLTGRFELGKEPFNKGKKGYGGWEPTQFPEGHKPHNYKPIGTERVNGDDYVDVKIADPNKWRGKHIVVWERHHGPVIKGQAVIFGDGNRRNFDPNNLICVSRAQLALMNKYGLIKNNADLTRTGVILATIHQKIGEKKRDAVKS